MDLALAALQQMPRYTTKEMEERERRRQREAEEHEEARQEDQDHDEDGDANQAEQVDGARDGYDPEGDPARLESAWWCVCGHCNRVPDNARIKMCVCCQEQDFERLVDKLENPPIKCITKHRNFEPVALNEDILEMMGHYTRERRGYGVEVEWTNRLYRLLAYQAYTFWIHTRLGKSVRRVVPACVVNSIRGKWPEVSPMDYVSYKDPEEDEIIDVLEM